MEHRNPQQQAAAPRRLRIEAWAPRVTAATMRCAYWLPFVSESGVLGEPVPAAAIGGLEAAVLGGPREVYVTGGHLGGGWVVAVIGGERVRLLIRVGEAAHGIEADGGRGGEVLGADSDAALAGVVADAGAEPAGGGDAEGHVVAGADGEVVLVVADDVRGGVDDQDQNDEAEDEDGRHVRVEREELAGELRDVYSEMESVWLNVEAAAAERAERRAEARRSGDWADAITFSKTIDGKIRAFIKEYGLALQ